MHKMNLRGRPAEQGNPPEVDVMLTDVSQLMEGSRDPEASPVSAADRSDPGRTGNRAPGNPILVCRGLSSRFGKKTALDHVDLEIPRGKIVGLLGPNGSGKTTFMKIANGLLMPSEGELQIAGNRPGPETKKIVSYLPDRDYLPDWMKVSELLRLFEDFYEDFNRDKAEIMIHSLGIEDQNRLRALSKGTREKVQLILTMSRRASLYLLDEPIGGVDPAARDYILNTIIANYNPEGTVLITTHLIADIEQVLDDVLFIDQGHIVLSKSVDEIREGHGKSVDQYFREVFRC